MTSVNNATAATTAAADPFTKFRMAMSSRGSSPTGSPATPSNSPTALELGEAAGAKVAAPAMTSAQYQVYASVAPTKVYQEDDVSSTTSSIRTHPAVPIDATLAVSASASGHLHSDPALRSPQPKRAHSRPMSTASTPRSTTTAATYANTQAMSYIQSSFPPQANQQVQAAQPSSQPQQQYVYYQSAPQYQYVMLSNGQYALMPTTQQVQYVQYAPAAQQTATQPQYQPQQYQAQQYQAQQYQPQQFQHVSQQQTGQQQVQYVYYVAQPQPQPQQQAQYYYAAQPQQMRRH